MTAAEQLRKDMRTAKNNLIKATKILIHHLEMTDEPDTAQLREIELLTSRVDYLQEEIMFDVNELTKTQPSGQTRLHQALQELKQQLHIEKDVFDKHGDNADKLLDINFRIQEIEDVLKTS